jgi:hypothetical protein
MHMADRTRLWRIGFAISVVVNVVGGFVALMGGGGRHAMLHALALAVTFAFWPKVAGKARGPTVEPESLPAFDTHIDNLQQSIDSIALEVERIGEAQRYAAKVLKEKAENENRG